MTVANAIFHILKDLYSLIQYFSNFFFMKPEVSTIDSALWLLTAESPVKTDILSFRLNLQLILTDSCPRIE